MAGSTLAGALQENASLTGFSCFGNRQGYDADYAALKQAVIASRAPLVIWNNTDLPEDIVKARAAVRQSSPSKTSADASPLSSATKCPRSFLTQSDPLGVALQTIVGPPSALPTKAASSSYVHLTRMVIIVDLATEYKVAVQSLNVALEFRSDILRLKELHRNIVQQQLCFAQRLREALLPLGQNTSYEKISSSLSKLRKLEQKIGTAPFVDLGEIESKNELTNERNTVRTCYIEECDRVLKSLDRIAVENPRAMQQEAKHLLRHDGVIRKVLMRGPQTSSVASLEAVKIKSFEDGEQVLNLAMDNVKRAMFSGSKAGLEKAYEDAGMVMTTLTNNVILTKDAIDNVKFLAEDVDAFIAKASEEPEVLVRWRTAVDIQELQRQRWLKEKQLRCDALVKEAQELRTEYSGIAKTLAETKVKKEHDEDGEEEDFDGVIKVLEQKQILVLNRRDRIARDMKELSLKSAETATGTATGASLASAKQSRPKGDGNDDDDSDLEVKCDFPEMFDRVMIEWNTKNKKLIARTSGAGINFDAREFLLRSNLLLPYSKKDDYNDVDDHELIVTALEGRNQMEILKLKVTDDLKVLKRITVTSKDDLRRLRRSLVLSRKVAHTCILACEGAVQGSRPSDVFLQFPYLAGGDLLHWTTIRPRPMQRKQDILAKISDALVALHQEGIFHRDLKPQNVVMTSLEDGADPKLTDFEYSKDLDHLTHVTMAGGVGNRVGTFGYMAPELLSMTLADSTSKTVLEPGDVFALGATYVVIILYDGLPQMIPRSGKPWFDVKLGLSNKLNEGVVKDKHFCEIISSALDEDPSTRPTSRHLRDVLCRRNCCLMVECGGEDQLLLGGLVCPQGKDFMCGKDVDKYVQGICDSGDLESAEGEVLCVARCGQGVFPLEDLKSFLSAETLRKFIDARVTAMERVLTQKMERRKEEAVKEALKMSVLEQKVVLARTHIVDNIMTNKCPACGVVWYDFEGCCALTCSNPNCKAKFCAICCAGPFPDAHPHVRSCEWNPVRGVYLPEETVQRLSNDRKRTQVREYFQQGEIEEDRDLKARVLNDVTVLGLLRDLGVVIST